MVNFICKGWYSTLSYYLSKITIDLLHTIVFSSTFAFSVYHSSGQIQEGNRLFGYVIVIVLTLLCGEGLGQIIGILLRNHEMIGLAFCMAVQSSMIMLMNFCIKIDDLPIIIQYVSEFIAFPRLYYDASRIFIYGLSRCSANQIQVILVKYNINDNHLMPIMFKFMAYIVITKILVLLALKFISIDKLGLSNIFRRKNSIIYEDENHNQVIVKIRRLSEHIVCWHNLDLDISDNRQSHPICIAFTDITVKIPKKIVRNEKVILNRINGFFEFCSLNALIGSSGAGKTSLLKSINGMYANLLTKESKIYLSKYRTIKTCFVTQDQNDHLMSGITAGQAMTYASKLKNSSSGQSVDHKKNVEDLMKELMIFNTYNTIVNKCSGGEQKRLAIAMELTETRNRPNIICIDEPTSGLDSYAAQLVSSITSVTKKSP